MKKILSLIMVISMTLSTLAFANEADILDTLNNHWAKDYITYLYNKDVIKPTGDSFTPNNKISRAELMRYINRSFNYVSQADISFTDVIPSDWHYNDVARAVYQGYIQGTGDSKMEPNAYVTRQEAVTILSRIHNVDKENTTKLNFTDTEQISDWALPYIGYAVENGYISGRANGSFDPKGYITRAEIAKILYFFAGNIVDDTTISQSDLNQDLKNVTISKGYTTLQNATVNGDIYISQGVENLKVTLENVTVKGKIIIASTNVLLKDVKCDNIIIKSPDFSKVTVTATGSTDILNTYVYTNASLVSEKNFTNVLEMMTKSAQKLDLKGNFRDVVLNSDALVNIDNSTISSLVINQTAVDTNVELSKTDITKAVINARSKVYGGSIYELQINSSGAIIDTTNVLYYVASGYKATLNGNEISGATGADINPSAIVLNKNDAKTDITVDVTFTSDDVLRVTYNGTILSSSDYTLSGGKFILRKAFLSTLTNDNNEIIFVMKDIDNIILTIDFVDSTVNSLNTYETNFDKYSTTSDVKVILVPTQDSTLTDILYGGYLKLSSSEYSVKGNEIRINADYLKTLAEGKAVFTFKMSQGNAPKLVINIKDSSPANVISPSNITFDTNVASTDYVDVSIQLTQNSGVLTGVFNGQTQLLENTDYIVRDNNIIIRREYFLTSGKTGEIELTFRMSKGVSPVLTVNVVKTIVAKAIFVDAKGLPIEGVTAKVGNQTSKSDKSGIAYFNLDFTNHTIEYSKTGYISESSAFYVSTTINEKTITLKVSA